MQDTGGAAIPDATVTVHNVGTGVDTTVKSGGAGDYTVPFLDPGNYTVRASAQGFREVVRNNVELHVQDKLTVDLSLGAGATSDVVTVTADPPLLDTGSATRGALIDNVKVTELPIIGRNPINLADLAPGVVFQGNQSFRRPFDNGDVINFSVNGGLRQANSFLIDGAPDDAYSDTAGDKSHVNLNVAFIPTAEVTQEFKVVSNFYDAQYGRTGGGIFNVITKSGTNQLHGDVYYFLQRYNFNANNVGNKFNNLPIYSIDPVTKQFLAAPRLDQYGLQVNGPVRIPGVYNGTDKTFFLFGIERYKENTPSPGLVGTITAAERNGDFSQSGVNIYDPYTTRLDARGNCCIRDQFPNNIIPAARLNGAGFKLAQAFPAPNITTATSNNNYNVGANLSIDRFNNYNIRIDQNFGQKERIYGRYSYGRRNQTDQGNTNYPLPLLDAQDPLARINNNAVLDSLTQLTPRLTMDLRVAYSRYNESVLRTRSATVDPTQYGFSSNYAAQRFVDVFPKLGFDNTNGVNLPGGLGSTGIGSRDPRFGISNIISFQPSVEWVVGRHSLHLGADLRDVDFNNGGASYTLGQGGFNFTRLQTQSNPTAAQTAGNGSSVAALLLGFPNNGIIQYTPYTGYRFRYYAMFIQDDFKLSNRLTINAGLRYDIEGSPYELHNRANRGFDVNAASPLAAAAASASSYCPACASLKGGLLFAGVGGQPRAFYNTRFGDIQPRIGAVYQVSKDNLFRGGYGLFYLPEAGLSPAQGFAQDTAMIPTNAAAGSQADNYRPRGNNPSAQPLNDPFATGVLQPTGSSLGLATFQGQSVTFNNPNRYIPYVHQFSFGMQQQLPYNIRIDVGYVGSRSNHINTNDNQAGGPRNLNVLSNAQIAQARNAAASGGFASASAYLSQTQPNPFFGLIPGSTLGTSPRLQLSQLLLPFPQFQTINYGQESVGKIWYDSLQIFGEKRYSQGLSISAAFTWSKTQEALAFLNPQDPAPFKNIGAQDRPFRFTPAMVFELPFGRHHQFFSNDSRWVEALIGGFQVQVSYIIQSGVPAGLNGGYLVVADPRIGSPHSKTQYFNTCTLNVNGTKTGNCSSGIIAFQQINSANLDLRGAPFQIGSIRNPNAPIGNASISKRVNITEHFNTQFRFEAFNFTNTYVPNGPDMTPTNNTFGTLSGATSTPNGQSNLPRVVQLGAKINF
ncbi:TonB-dependent receptor [Terriglobus aquaticus]|uniref:TonB-dependent receptor domain-containing protein n=1 Tax=Terriglobus aquaticus TaxID=940139 RepID=A0ABW9KK36_9BACT|nr:TonB-dependent receptor [Terriglobus aquaticus]